MQYALFATMVSVSALLLLAVLQGKEIAQLRKFGEAQSAVSLNLTAELMRLYGYDESIIGPLFRAAQKRLPKVGGQERLTVYKTSLFEPRDPSQAETPVNYGELFAQLLKPRSQME